MFFFEPTQLKNLRMKQGVTQTELAKTSGVSQSVIAKIESGKIDPSYSSVKKIFEALNNDSKNSQLAGHVLNPKLIVAKSNEPIKDVIKLMKEHEISQVPVVEERKIIGLATESSILEYLSETTDPAHFISQPVSIISTQSPPMIPKNTPLHVVLSLLSHFPMLVVFDNHKYLGGITKADLLNRIGDL